MTGKKIKRKMEKTGPLPARTGIIRCSIIKAILMAALLTIIGFVIHTVAAIMTMDYYMDPAYFEVWSKVMMPEVGPPPVEFTYLSLAFGFITALIYVWAYKTVEPALSGFDGWFRKGLLFGALLFLIGTVPGSLSLYLLINLPAALIAWWTVSGLVIALINGAIIARFC